MLPGPQSWPGPLPLSSTGWAILDECLDLARMLLEKNRRYGNSALEPVRIFSRADPAEQLRVRIDDKLSRIRTADPADAEDAVLDLLGYLVLYRVAAKRAAGEAAGRPAVRPAGAKKRMAIRRKARP
jgi:hypothetical protein